MHEPTGTRYAKLCHPWSPVPGPGFRRVGERGAALVTVLILIIVLTLVGVAMVNVALTEISIAYNQGDAAAAEVVAEAGVARAVYELGVNPAWPGVTDMIGDGQYQVTVTSSGTVRFIESVGTRAGGRQRLRVAIKVLPQFMLYAVLANTTTTFGTGTPSVQIRNALPPVDAGAVHASNRLGAATAITVNTTGATIIGGVTANGAISGISCPSWQWRCSTAFGILPFPRLDVDSAAPASLKSRARNTLDPIDGKNLYFRGGDATSRCNSGGGWTFGSGETQRCWDRYVSDRSGAIGANIPNAVFFVEFNAGEQTRYAVSGAQQGITFRGAASASRDGASSLTISKPAGVVDNDVLIAAISVRGGSATTITAPAGWTLVRRINNGTTLALAIYRKVASAEGASYAWNFSPARDASGGIQAYAGVDTTAPVDVENGQPTPSGLSHSTPSVTTTVPNTMLVTSFAIALDTTWTPPTGQTERYDVFSGGTTSEGNDQLQIAAGASGVKTATAADDTVGAAHILALRPGSATVTADCTGFATAVETLCIRARPATASNGAVVYPSSDLREVTGTIVTFRRGSGTSVAGDIALENVALRTADYVHRSLDGDQALLAAGQLLAISSGSAGAQHTVTIRGYIYTLARVDNPDGANNLQGSASTGIDIQHGADLVTLIFEGIVMSNGAISILDTAANTGTVAVEYDSAAVDVLPAVFTAAVTGRIIVPMSWSSGD